jgi:hypothetical protein
MVSALLEIKYHENFWTLLSFKTEFNLQYVKIFRSRRLVSKHLFGYKDQTVNATKHCAHLQFNFSVLKHGGT